MFHNCTWQCSKTHDTVFFQFSEYLTSGRIVRLYSSRGYTYQFRHTRALHVEFRIPNWREIPPSPRYFREYPSIRQSDSQSLLSSRDKDRNVPPRSERDGRENYHWFCRKRTVPDIRRLPGESRSLVKSYRVSGPIEGCLRKVDYVRKLRTGRKSE